MFTYMYKDFKPKLDYLPVCLKIINNYYFDYAMNQFKNK